MEIHRSSSPEQTRQHDPQRRRTASDRRHSSSRELVLRAIESHGPASISELAERTGLHENTVRGHVSRLRTDGYVRSESTSTDAPGRPARRWRATAPELLAPYTGLAVILADALAQAGTAAPALARSAGEAWGAKLAAEHGRGPDRADPRALVIGIMREQGFDPAATRDGISLRRCPLLAAANSRTEIVCSVHEGMIAGIASGRASADDAPEAAGSQLRVQLQPFAEPGACALRLLSGAER